MPHVVFDFSDSVVLVTGAARGVGRAIVTRFAEAGAVVTAVDRDKSGLEETISLTSGSVVPDLPGNTPSARVTSHVIDIRDNDAVGELCREIERVHGRIDICVNNAAVAPHRSLAEYREDLWDSVFAVNAKGTFLMTQAVGDVMIRRNTRGRIINFSSGAAIKGGHGSAAYASSRAATEAFSRVAAMELAPYGITVNTVRPGLIDTQPKPLPVRMAESLRNRIPKLPLQRPGKDYEVASLVLFLASPLSSYMTGSVVTVDGGASVGTYSDQPVVDDDPRYLWLSRQDDA